MCKALRLLSDLVWHRIVFHVEAEDALNTLAVGLIAASAVMLAWLVI